jgi:hypothetical protein
LAKHLSRRIPELTLLLLKSRQEASKVQLSSDSDVHVLENPPSLLASLLPASMPGAAKAKSNMHRVATGRVRM